MSGLLHNLFYSIRQLRRSPGFAAAVIVTIALGIGANSTIFSWIQATLLTPIPAVAHTADLFSVERGQHSDNPMPPFSYLDLRDLEQRNRTLVGLLGYHDDWMLLTGAGRPERVYGALATANYFDLLGVRPVLGRAFMPQEEQPAGGAAVAVIGYALWQSRFAGDPAIVGRKFEINRQPFTIIGVAPKDFIGCKTGMRTDLWVPVTNDDAVFRGGRIPNRDVTWLNVLGKLRRGVSLSASQDELNRLMQQLAVEYPESHRGPNAVTLCPLWRSPFGANGYLADTLPLLLALAGVVLLLACANVATLLLVRSVSRRREVAIRLALGASRSRVMQQLLLESVVLALAGGVVAVWLTTWTAGTFAQFLPPTSSPITLNGRFDGTVLMATLLAAVLAGLAFGILPALRASNLVPLEVLKQEAGSVSIGTAKARLFSGLVIAQIAISMVLLVCAGLFLRTLRNTERADTGFRPGHLLLVTIDTGQGGLSSHDSIQFQRQLLDRLGALPGADSVALADWVPLSLSRHSNNVIPEGYVPRLHESMDTRAASVTPGYFKTMVIPIVAGRDFSAQDDEHAPPVAIIDETMASLYWAHGDAIGRRLQINDRWFSIIGIARNTRHNRVNEPPEPMVYKSLEQFPQTPAVIHLRTAQDPQSMAAIVEETVHSLNADVPVFDAMPLETSVRLANMFERIGGVFVGSFGLIALVLATVGIYGVVAYTTRQRTHELGIRIALGASRAQILSLILKQGAALISAGIGIGLALSFGVTRLLQNSLYGVSTMDPVTLIGISVLLAMAGILACYAPARHAMAIDPTQAVRAE